MVWKNSLEEARLEAAQVVLTCLRISPEWVIHFYIVVSKFQDKLIFTHIVSLYIYDTLFPNNKI